MIYIIDANNLAGKLELLEEDDFDKRLIELIKRWSIEKNKKIILVFDSIDPMGDKIKDGNMTIVYTPRDNYYQSADDKILELVKNFIKNKKEEITVISDDRAIREAIEKSNEVISQKIHAERASLFAEKLKDFMREKQAKNKEDDKSLSAEEVKGINKDLLKIWK